MWGQKKDESYAPIPEATAMPINAMEAGYLHEQMGKGAAGDEDEGRYYRPKPEAAAAGGGGYEDEFGSSGYEAQLRLGFIRKVYGILSFQLALTVVFSAMAMYIVPMRNFIAGNSAVLYTSLIVSLVLLVTLMCYKNEYPTSVILLGLWTFAEAVTVGVVTATYATAGAGDIVIEAFLITMTVFVALTLFTFQTKIDFSFLGGFLFAGLWILIIWGVISAIIGVNIGTAYAAFGALIFTLYILFDTSLIINRLGYDEYILAAISLYLDILNLFLYILQLLSRDR